MRTRDDLRQLQALPLELKISMTRRRIREWVREYGIDGVYVSFSGGKDSTVLLHIVREMYPEVEAVFVNTGLEYPEIQAFVKSFDNVTILRPKMRFDEVIKKYGYPIISKEISEKIRGARTSIAMGSYTLRLRQLGVSEKEYGGLTAKHNAIYHPTSMFNCEKYRPLIDTDFSISEECCNEMKKKPAQEYERATGKKPLIGQLAAESKKRTQAWLNTGCNAFEAKRPQSNPMAFWTEQDVLQYIKRYEIPIASVYGSIEYATEPEQVRWSEIAPELAVFESKEQQQLKTTGCDRTGCIFCAFGCHLEKEPSRFQHLKETHPRQYQYCIDGGEYDEAGVWKPNKQGLGMGHVFDELNKIYGEGFIKY